MNKKLLLLWIGLLALTGCNRPYLFYDPVEHKAQSRERMSVRDVISMTKAGLSDEIIIEKILQGNATFSLTSRDLNALRSNQVSEKVITFMMTRRPKPRYKRRTRRSYSSAPYYMHYYYDYDPWCRPYNHRMYGRSYYYTRPSYSIWR